MCTLAKNTRILTQVMILPNFTNLVNTMMTHMFYNSNYIASAVVVIVLRHDGHISDAVHKSHNYLISTLCVRH